MVNTIRNFPQGPKPNLSVLDDDQRKITTQNGRPIYNLEEVKKLLRADPNKIVLATEEAEDYAEKADLYLVDIAFIFSLLTPRDYIDSAWCYSSARMVIDCDAYAIRLEYNRKEKDLAEKHIRTRNINDGIEYYIKFGSPNTKTIVISIVSLHPSKY